MWRRWCGASRRTRSLIALIVGLNLVVLGAAVYVAAQGPYAFTPNSLAPTQDAAYDLGIASTNRFRNLYLSGSVTQGSAGTAITQIRVATASFAPTILGALPGGQNATTIEQTFTSFSWLTVGDKVFVNGPAPTAACAMTSARVSATASLTLGFTQTTAASCTPATGTYTVTAIRSAVSVTGQSSY